LLDALLNKDKTLDMAAEANSRFRPLMHPRAWLGQWVLRRGIAAERETLRHRGEPSQGDLKSYLPRDMALSYFQARRDEQVAGADVTDQRTATGVAFAEGVSLRHGFDYHWVTEFFTELGIHLVRRVLFSLPRAAPRTGTLASDARLVLVGDWGTGEGAALAVAAQMRRRIDEAAGREVHVVHLGDVYYAGTRWEAEHRFLDHWPVRAEEAGRVRSWCLNGNHDMYSAGEGLFDVILADPRFAAQRTERDQRTSEFHLRNEHWDVLGLDTSWRFRLTDIRGGAGWLPRRGRRWLTERLTGSDRRRMLMSHHQPFTDRDDGAGVVPVGNLLEATREVRSRRGIDAWFWGHEHRLVTFGERHAVRYTACMGHGAVLEEPVTAAKAAQRGPGEAEFEATFTDSDGDRWRMPGFAVVDLDGPRATVSYIDQNGEAWRAPDTV
jgi:hypothetical protein